MLYRQIVNDVSVRASIHFNSLTNSVMNMEHHFAYVNVRCSEWFTFLLFSRFRFFLCFILLLFNSRPSRNLCMRFDFCLLFVMQQHSKCNKRCSRKKRKQIFVSTDLSNIVLHTRKTSQLRKIKINFSLLFVRVRTLILHWLILLC